MHPSEKPLFFESGKNRIFSIFHPAANGSKEWGIIFANSGMQNRCGPHRLYLKLARQLAERGYSVLRLDFPGIGESDGEVKETHFDAHNPLHTVSAIDFMVEELGIRNIALYGLCAGARNAIKAGAMDKRVSAVVMWSVPIIWMPPIFPSPMKDPRGYMSRKGAMMTLGDRARKSVSVNAWRNYFRKGGNLKGVFLYIRSIVWNIFADEEKWSRLRHRDFFESMDSYIKSGRKILFLYGDKDDVLIEEFDAKFQEISHGITHQVEKVVIKDGNHSFTNIQTEVDAVGHTIEWLERWRVSPAGAVV